MMMTQSLHAIANGIAYTESPEKPVIRVTTIVIYRPIVTTVVVCDSC